MDQYNPDHLEDASEERKERARIESAQAAEDVRWMMSSPQGRRLIWRLLCMAGVFRSSFRADQMQMVFAEGNKNYGLKVLAMIHAHAPEQYSAMISEANINE